MAQGTPAKRRPPTAVGRSEPRRDGPARVTGRELYGADLICREAEVFAVAVRSAEAHARILGVDVAAARREAGVLGVFTAREVRGTNRHGLIVRDQPVLAGERVLYRGDAVALVTAESEEAARRGAARVRVRYRRLPVVASFAEALRPGAPRLRPDGNVMGERRIRRGDAAATLRECPIVLREVFRTQSVDHAFLDLEAGVARWDGRRLVIRAPGQWVHEEQRLVAGALGLPLEAVRIVAPATGGAFGGREDLGIQLLLGLAALQHPGRTVGMRYTREESMRARHKRHALEIDYTLGATRDGRIQAVHVVARSEEGAYASTAPAVLRKAASHCTGPYRVPHVTCDVVGVHTNNNPKGAMRGFGTVQMSIACEGMLDRLAGHVGVSRAEIRRRNLIHDGETVTTGQVIPVASGRACLDAALRQLKAGSIGRLRRLAPHERRGIGVSCICFGLGYGDHVPDASSARVRLLSSGRVRVESGVCDTGQGLTTLVAQLAAVELGLRVDEVEVRHADSARTPESGSTSASRQTFLTGHAVMRAAADLRHRLAQWAGVPPNSVAPKAARTLVKRAARLGVRRVGQGRAEAVTAVEQASTGLSPRAFATYLFAAHACQVVVDLETGRVTVERHVAAHDVGRALNPQTVAGQIAGGVAQGLGMALTEGLVTRAGRILNDNFRDYLLPTTRDLPLIEPVIVERPDPEGPHGARGLGEPPVIASVPAVLSAIGAATGRYPAATPCSPERVWRLLRANAQPAQRRRSSA